MVSVFVLAAVAASSVPAAAGPAGDPALLDRRCFRLMAGLAESGDPRMRSLGLVAAQYFLGRLDARGEAVDLEAHPASLDADRSLLSACGEVMGEAGRDFRRIGEALAPPDRPAI